MWPSQEELNVIASAIYGEPGVELHKICESPHGFHVIIRDYKGRIAPDIIVPVETVSDRRLLVRRVVATVPSRVQWLCDAPRP